MGASLLKERLTVASVLDQNRIKGPARLQEDAVARSVADDLVARWRATGRDACAAPVVSFGASGEHAGFAGTVSIDS